MCIIALDTRHGSHERIDRDVLERCFEKNPHGIGLMYPWENPEGGPILKTWKTLDDFDGMWDRYTTVRDAGGIIGIHFRKTSVGDDSLENAHPFMYQDGDQFGFMHNGTIDPLKKIADKLDGISDTRLFQENIFNKLPSNWIQTDGLYHMVRNFIGRSRLLFMDAAGNYCMFNEHIGYWWPDDHQGKRAKRHVWFSHMKGKHYIQTGRKIVVTGYSRVYGDGEPSGKAQSGKDTAKSSTTSSDTKTHGTKRRRFPRSDDDWYRRRAADVQRNGLSREAREVNMIFEYGDMQEGLDGPRHGLRYVADAWMPNAELWAVEDTHFNEIVAGITESGEFGDTVLGSLYAIEAPTGITDKDILNFIDGQEGNYEESPEDSYFIRVRKPVYWVTQAGSNIVYPWVYFCNMGMNEPIEVIEDGSWESYKTELAEYQDQRDIEEPSVIDSPQCPRCFGMQTLAIEGYVEMYGYVKNHVYCRSCEREFDAHGNVFIRPMG